MRSRSHSGNVRQGCGLSMTGVKVCSNNTCTGRLNNNPRGFCFICTRRSVRQAEWCGPHLPSSTVQVGACAAVTGGNSSAGRGVVRQGSSGVTHPAYFRSVWGGGGKGRGTVPPLLMCARDCEVICYCCARRCVLVWTSLPDLDCLLFTPQPPLLSMNLTVCAQVSM